MRKGILTTFVLLAFSSTAMGIWTGTESDRNISYFSNDTKSTWYVHGACGPEGNLYIVWQQEQSPLLNGLFFGMSTDNGVTWSSEAIDRQINAVDSTNISGAGDRPLDICTDDSGDIFIVWPEEYIVGTDTSSEIMFVKSTDRGMTWLHSDVNFPISHTGAPFADAFNPSMTIDHNNHIYVVWHQANPLNTSEIHISKSTDGGDTWSGQAADRSISYYDGFNAANPDIATDQNNAIYVVWDEATDTTLAESQILHGKSTDGGITFTSETADLPISVAIRSANNPYMVTDLQNNVYVTWRATFSMESPLLYQALFSSSTDGGASWSGNNGPIMVDPGILDDFSINYPAIAVTSKGYLIVAWNEAFNTAVNQQVYASYSYDGGQSWTALADGGDILGFPEPQVRPSYCPDIVCSPGDTLHVFWNEGVGSDGINDVHYSRGDTIADAYGTLFGLVVNQNDFNPIPDVIVETYDSLNQLVAVDTSGLGGEYDTYLHPGIYRQHFSKAGYDDLDISNVEILLGQILDLWAYMNPVPGCPYVCGDINGNGTTNGIDVGYGVNYFKGGPVPPIRCDMCPQPAPFFAGGDVNGNCIFNGIDITFFVNYLKGIVPTLLSCPSCPPAP